MAKVSVPKAIRKLGKYTYYYLNIQYETSKNEYMIFLKELLIYLLHDIYFTLVITNIVNVIIS